MVEVFDNPSLKLEEDVIQKDGTDVFSDSVPNNKDALPQPLSSVTVVDTNNLNTGQASSKENVSTTDHYDMTLSICMWRIIDIIISRRGLILVALSALFYSWMSILIEILSKRLGVYQTVFMIMPTMFIGPSFGIFITHAQRPKRITHYPWLLLSGICTFLAITAFALSVTYIDVADAVAVSYISLIIVCVLSWLILKEPLRPLDVLFSFIALAGVVFIARPISLFDQSHEENDDSASNYLLGIIFALVSAVGIGSNTVSFRKQSQLKIDKFVTMLACACVLTLSNAVLCTALNQWLLPDLHECMYATAAGLCYFFAQLCLIMSLKLETATIVGIVLTLEIVFTFVWQFLFLGVSPLWTSYVGALLLILASVGITLYKNKTTDPQLPEPIEREQMRRNSE